ncbi:sigma-70 family RNA polymerase sigma factor [Trichothermofontia sichuanensis B231]|uniref:sigma-70 family RNA polymerase sigma factor n=1 Tax=Trichothermofontia sichuanensis TaxID=3045816 RepID=UPI002248087B|nr:sigma-70 family RNA polymerase sigma factor [Trichothermofontia sichuanensis]UZQ55865.1 sigma-70 family RNA polymerase sigma factor [Trichothermofontia sichuanensis B231]
MQSASPQSPSPRATGHISQYLYEIGKYPLLTPDQEVELGQHVQAMMALVDIPDPTPAQKQVIQRGRRARDQLIQSNLRLVVAVARHFQRQGVDLPDLIQEGCLGLARAAERFDPTKGFRFSTYAYPWIRQTIARSLATQPRLIRLPVHVYENLNRLKRLRQTLTAELGRTPTVAELAAGLETSTDEVQALLLHHRPTTSLNTQAGADEGHEWMELIASAGATPADLLDQEAQRELAHQLVGRLPERMQETINLRYGMADGVERTFVEIGKHLQLSKERVRQIEAQAIEKLRAEMQREEAIPAVGSKV